MHETRRNRQWVQDAPVLKETTTYPLGINGGDESATFERQQNACADAKETEFLRLYSEGKRDFPKVDLQEADLQGANLKHIRLIMANLRWTNLRGANLRGAKLRGADLREADLREADLRGANLQDADLTGAQLAGAKLDDVTQISDTWRLIWETINNGNNGHRLCGKLPR